MNDLTTRLSFPDDTYIVILLVRIRWWFGRRSTDSLSKVLDISPVKISEITRSSEYLDELRYLMRTVRNRDEIAEWIETYPDMENKFSKRMGIDVETARQLILELVAELEGDDEQ